MQSESGFGRRSTVGGKRASGGELPLYRVSGCQASESTRTPCFLPSYDGDINPYLRARCEPAWNIVEHQPQVGTGLCWRPYLRTAKSLALVCKSWHAPATEILYRKAILTSALDFPLLYHTLATAPGNRGQFVRSLSMTFDISRHSQGSNRLMYEYFDKILGLCSNLKHLMISEQDLFSIYPPVSVEKPVFPQWSRLAQIVELRLDASRDHSTLNFAEFLRICVNLESLAVTWPDSMTETTSETITLPRLHALEVTGQSCGIGRWLSLPALQSLTFCFSGVVEKDGHLDSQAYAQEVRQIVMPLVEAYGQTLRRLHLNLMPIFSPSHRLGCQYNLTPGYQFKDAASDQEFIDLCPNLGHYITYTTGDRLDLSHHQSLRWMDVWVPPFDHDDLFEDPKPDILDSSVDFPRLESFRILDGSLSVFPDLPIIISPDILIPREQIYATWSFSDAALAQTHHGVTWLNEHNYDSDTDSWYTYSSPSEEPSEEFMSDSDEGEVGREIQSRLTDFIDEEGGSLST
ncbi:hypothetical protein EVG20_g3747 [Dentipellis fragilis]|uniref:F-box domain-containing protein n=1 Tax=Dentipellis fragilis TaxID=205917 RepID=A0A4Y9YZE2_9AGAM|nr:hypothetical protein EVG20_g3747 [Dentipellis fragilis]